MKKHHLAVVVAVVMAVAGAPRAAAQPLPQAALDPDVAAAVSELQPAEMATVSVQLAARADLSGVAGLSRRDKPRAVEAALKATAAATQPPILARLDQLARAGQVGSYEAFWVNNGVVVTATADAIAEIASRGDIASVSVPRPIEPAGTYDPAGIEPNLSLVGAPALWSQGITGEGVVVATLDTGVYQFHPDLVGSYRGGANSWFDPYGQHATPFDGDGHGSATMSVIAGRDASGSAIGVAPDARWVAARIFDDSGSATAAAVHAAFEWVLDPDGDPGTPDTPDVVNNSWTNAGSGCDTEFQPDLVALRAAGILPVFAAGNAGPAESSSRSPGNLPEAFSVGAIDNTDAVYPGSSRGPSACAGDQHFPDVVAPGVSITAADNSGLYWSPSGTSLAAPHVAGALALLLDGAPTLGVAEQEAALAAGAVDLGAVGDDGTFGRGRIDVAASFASIDPVPPNQPPVASFEVRTRKGVSSFDAAGSTDSDGTIVAYEWDFGDGTSGSGVQVDHEFAPDASYDVVLTVTDDDGAVGVATETLTIGGGRGGGGGGGGGGGHGGGGHGGGGKPSK